MAPAHWSTILEMDLKFNDKQFDFCLFGKKRFYIPIVMYAMQASNKALRESAYQSMFLKLQSIRRNRKNSPDSTFIR